MRKFVDKVKAANWGKTLRAVANLGVVATSVGVSVGVAAAEPLAKDLAKGIEDMAVKGLQSATSPSTMTVRRTNKGVHPPIYNLPCYCYRLFHPPTPEREGASDVNTLPRLLFITYLLTFLFFPCCKEAESLRREQQMVQRAKAEAERKVLENLYESLTDGLWRIAKAIPFLIHLANQSIDSSRISRNMIGLANQQNYSANQLFVYGYVALSYTVIVSQCSNR